MVKVAMIGSRGYSSLSNIDVIFLKLAPNKDSVRIITGGAKGVDKYVEDYCIKNDWRYAVIRPLNPKNKLDYLFRNVEIITLADMIYAFWDGESRGTKFVIDYAKARGKIIEVIR